MWNMGTREGKICRSYYYTWLKNNTIHMTGIWDKTALEKVPWYFKTKQKYKA